MRTWILITVAALASHARSRVPVAAAGRMGRPAPVRLRRPPRPTTDEPGRRVGATSLRVILTTGLALLYVAGCLAALSLLAGIWGASL